MRPTSEGSSTKSLIPVQQNAYDSISSRLHESFLNDVNEDDLNSVRETLGGLGAVDADAVIDEMARTEGEFR